MFRGSPQTFATDAKALAWASELVVGSKLPLHHAVKLPNSKHAWLGCSQDSGSSAQLPTSLRVFLYMPFMHSESLEVQQVRSSRVQISLTPLMGPSRCNVGLLLLSPMCHSEPLAQAPLTLTLANGAVPPPLPSPQRGIALYTGEVERLEAASVAAGPGGPDPTPVTNMMKLQLGYAKRHARVIAQWGRFPHRCEYVCVCVSDLWRAMKIL